MFNTKKKDLFDNLINSEQYKEDMSLFNELLKNKEYTISSNNINILDKHIIIEFLAYMYGYNLSVESIKDSYIFKISKKEDFTITKYKTNNIFEKIDSLYFNRNEIISHEKNISNYIEYILFNSDKGILIPRDSILYSEFNLNIECYLEELLDYKDYDLIRYESIYGLYLNIKKKKHILSLKI